MPRSGQHQLPRGDATEDLAGQCGGSELRDRRGGQPERLPQRHRSDGAADVLEHVAERDQVEPRSPVCLGHERAQHAGLGEGGPQLAVEPGVAAGLEAPQAFVGGGVAEHLGGELGDRLLFVVAAEVHGGSCVLSGSGSSVVCERLRRAALGAARARTSR